jgi:hypothetical protein
MENRGKMPATLRVRSGQAVGGRYMSHMHQDCPAFQQVSDEIERRKGEKDSTEIRSRRG